MFLHLKAIGKLEKSLIVARPAGSTRKVIMIKRVRFKVTTSLYLNINNRARSLSKLIAVIVNKDAKAKIMLVA